MSVKIWMGAGVLALAAASAGYYSWGSNRFATREQATKMVKAIVADLKKDEKGTLKTISAKEPKWRDRDLYPVVYSTSGVVYAHGQNERQVGLNLIALKDPNGKLFVQERVDLAAKQASFWQTYKFTDPVTRTAVDKEAYCERTGVDMIVCAGIYKR